MKRDLSDGAERMLLRWLSIAGLPYPRNKKERRKLEKMIMRPGRLKAGGNAPEGKKPPPSFYGNGHAPKAIMGKANRYSSPTGAEVDEE